MAELRILAGIVSIISIFVNQVVALGYWLSGEDDLTAGVLMVRCVVALMTATSASYFVWIGARRG